LLIVFIVDSELDASLDLILVLFIEFMVELLDEEDDFIEFVLLEALEFGDDVAGNFLLEGDSSLVKFADFLIVGIGL
jgi:hypothetical protein